MASSASKDLALAADLGTGGFSARLQGASLWDLVQMECLGRTHRAVRITSGPQAGLLFFDGGRVIHAETAHALGEAAAMEILSWVSGSFDPCDSAWPRLPTITTSTEGLLLKAAQGRDEGPQSNLVAFPGRTGARAPNFEPPLLADDKDWESEVTRPAGPSIGLGFDANRRDSGAAVIDLPIAARLAANGTVIETNDDDLADAVAYAGRLAGLIGELLGLEGFRALECASKEERLVIYVEEEGGLVAGRVPAAADVSILRDRLGL
ncbi:MAG TPA: DUF4388 domain-containing protein [Polyangia bacterium]